MYGLFQDLRIVGAKPNKSTSVANITENTGCLAINHKPKERNAKTKKMLSIFTISILLFCTMPNTMTAKHMMAAAKVTNAPEPAPPVNWSAKARDVTTAQRNQLYT